MSLLCISGFSGKSRGKKRGIPYEQGNYYIPVQVRRSKKICRLDDRKRQDSTLAEMKMADPGEVGQYDVILLFWGHLCLRISGLSFLKKHINQWKDKKIAVFCVGASPWDETAFQAVKNIT